ncbi:Hypothetical protein SRAE_1000258300 [Strongyloides ratti]|uniref:C2H2-type domain-containing protein n=1 Tax=Strongyloides ratti TaxID=34506 RepID=A0A090L886_STRRB|nr:Hypothetical protein SRAE_1000258300 [Strongyloides ratti]CEF64328.1 Hypothetical protein SRAE_1000258300 [Strongyloides ratti]
MNKKHNLKRLNENHCKSILDILNITTKSSTHRKCKSCKKEYLLCFGPDTIYKHCIVHEELRRIIKSNVPGSCYERYVRLAGLKLKDTNDVLQNTSSNMGNSIVNEFSSPKKISTIFEKSYDFKNNDTLEKENIVRPKDTPNVGTVLQNFCNTTKQSDVILENSIVDGSHLIKIKTELQSDNEDESDMEETSKTTKPSLSSDSVLRNLNNIRSDFSELSNKFFKQTCEYGLTVPTFNGLHKCSCCKFRYPPRVFLLDVYLHSARHDRLMCILEKKLEPSVMEIIKKNMEKSDNTSLKKENSKENKPKYMLRNKSRDISLTSHIDNEKKKVSMQPCLAVIEKLRRRPFETDVINLTHVENGFRICNECKKMFTLNDRPYNIYKHCFHHKNLHKILIDNLEHNFLLDMLRKAKREQKQQTTRK